MFEEPVLFVAEDNRGNPTASLLFAPQKILRVTSADGASVFVEGKDYIWKPGSRSITIPANSRISFKTRAQMHPLPGSPNSYSADVDGNHHLFFSEGHLFHDLQVVFTYTHNDKWDGYKPGFAGDQLPRSVSLLRGRRALKLVVLGDSISAGYNASGFTKAPPFQPPYADTLTSGLRAAYGSPVVLKNLSVAGMTSAWGLEQVQAVIAQKPDLVIIAFGMNDAGQFTPEAYSNNIRGIMDGVRQACPKTEFILVATMTGNPDWTGSHYDRYYQYRSELASLTRQGCALADMTTMWTDVLKYKKFVDITGNGLNHPNDFGHRLYASVLLELLVK